MRRLCKIKSVSKPWQSRHRANRATRHIALPVDRAAAPTSDEMHCKPPPPPWHHHRTTTAFAVASCRAKGAGVDGKGGVEVAGDEVATRRGCNCDALGNPSRNGCRVACEAYAQRINSDNAHTHSGTGGNGAW
uniref:HDC03108 n=1 Tax=Drosophila melanogaster TaxID=7227 RepID=Q6IH71_DROME|nr:TPA_inf: HDC03108 [Drosophila melanogaster]